MTSATDKEVEVARTARARALRFVFDRYDEKKAAGISDGRDDAKELEDARTDGSSIPNQS